MKTPNAPHFAGSGDRRDLFFPEIERLNLAVTEATRVEAQTIATDLGVPLPLAVCALATNGGQIHAAAMASRRLARRKARALSTAAVKSRLGKLLANRVRADTTYDQCLATPATVLQRAKSMLEYGDIVGKNVLLLGDDDFLSVVLASLRSAARIVVIDVDARVIERIGQIATREKLDITIVHHDYRNALPHDLTSIFDTVFVDPPYTPSALQVAVNRAIDALRPEGDKRCYICYSSMDLSSKAILGFQSYLCARHLVWIGLHQSFNRYSARPDMDDEAVRCGYQPTRNWFASSLACLSTTEGTAQTAARLPEDPIYCYE